MATVSVKRNTSKEAPSNSEPPDEEIAHYASLSPERRNAAALEMAKEISEQQDRIFCVLTVALDYLRKSPDENPIAQSLMEVAEDLICDKDQNWRLIKCLESAEAANARI